MRPRHKAGLRALVLPLVLLATSCVDGDAPTDPSRVAFSSTAQLAVAPQFAGTSGQALSAEAAQEAFGRLTCFELTAVRISDGEVAAEETFRVEPGQDEYELSVEVDLEETPESFRVTITAYASSGGDACGFELFSGTSEVSVEADGLSDGGGDGSTPSTLTLSPSGPQAEASELRLDPGHAVLSGGGTVELAPTLLDDGGSVISDGEDLAAVLTWSSSSSGTASVDDVGTVTGGSDGVAEITAETVTGLSASIPVYVASGEFAYVSGGSLIRTTVDGEGTETVASDAGRPAWRPDGSGLAYESGGSIHEVGGGVLLSEAGSPAFSPDGAYVAGASAGSLAFATADGEFQAEGSGPAGSSPQWLDGATLVVGGGSIERVRADGGERTVLADHSSDRLPAAGGGLIAFLSDRGPGGTGVFVLDAGGGEPDRITPESFDASGRPSLAGGWILVPGSGDFGSGLHLVPADGSAPPLPLSIPEGGAPAWKPDGGGTPPALQISGLEPERPEAGQEVTILGGGFAWVVPEANTVEVPVLSAATAPGQAGLSVQADATVEVEVIEATEGSLTFLAPDNLAAGTVSVSTPFSETSFELEPASGDLRAVVETSSGKLVEGVEVEIPDGSGGVLASGTTGSDGRVLLEDLPTGDHTVAVTAPEGFSVEAPDDPVSIALDQTTELTLDATALPWSLTVAETSITFEAPELTKRIDYVVADIDGDPTDAAIDFTRVPGSVVQARLREGQIELESLNPGEATVTVTASAPASSPSAATTSGGSDSPTGTAASASGAASGPAPSATIQVEVLKPPRPTKGILVYGPTMSEPTSSRPDNEQTLAEAAGFEVTVVDGATWSSMTTSDFSEYNALVFGDKTCESSTSVLSDAMSNQDEWSAAVEGPVMVYATDPQWHQYQSDPVGTQTRTLIRNGIDYAASGTATGLSVSLSCYYHSASPGTPIELLAGIGDFTVTSGGQNNISIVDPSHPAMTDLTSSGLSDWGNTAHARFDSWPSTFDVLAITTDGGDLPLILARSGGAASASSASSARTIPFTVSPEIEEKQTVVEPSENPNLPPEELEPDLDALDRPREDERRRED